MKLQLFILLTANVVLVTSREASVPIPCDYGCRCADYFWVYDDEGESDDPTNSSKCDTSSTLSQFHIIEVDCRSRNMKDDIPLLLKNTTRLMLAHNSFKTIPADSFREYPNVAELDLTYCGIQKIHVNAFRGMRSISVLSLTGNELVSLPDGVFTGLTRLFALYMDYNHFTKLPPLKPLEHLSTLRLNENRLETVSADAFADSVRLSRLGLYNNKLTTFPSSMARLLERNPSGLVTIGNNPWTCDCRMLELKKIWPDHPRVLFDSFYCATPYDLEGQNLWHIDESKLLCNVTNMPQKKEQNGHSFTTATMVGAVIGAAVLVAILTSVVWLIICRVKSKNRYSGDVINHNSFVQLENKDDV